MKIQKLTVRGFRSLSHIEWAPGDLNLVIGPNASGKTNLLRVLELLSVAARGGLGKYVQGQGGIEPLLWDGRVDSITLQVNFLPQISSPQSYFLRLGRIGKTSSFRVDKESYLQDENTSLIRDGRQAAIFDANRNYVESKEDVAEDETLLSMTSGPFAVNRNLQHVQQEFASWSIYKDFDSTENAAIRKPAVTRMEKRIAPDGQNLTSVLHTLYSGDRDFKREINLAMRTAFGEEFEELIFPPAADQLVQLRIRWKSLKREQSAADLSDGTLRFLFLLAVLGSSDPAPLIAIDEPEVGLHPSMLPIIAEYAVQASKKSQVILTTHSPAMLDAFTNLHPTITVAHWVDGKTELQIKSSEELAQWLKEYTPGEIYRTGELEAVE